MMGAIREPGKINDSTTLIDIGMSGVYGLTAVYLVRGAKTCLVDGGTRNEASGLIKGLKAIDAFPPDMILITHPHYDHAQGTPFLVRAASEQNKRIQILAAHQAVSLLADPTFNAPFGKGPYESIQDVTPVKEGDVIDLGDVTLRIYEVPGHCQGHIAILDEKHKNIFVGDAIGLKLTDRGHLPPFMPPTWDPEAFHSSLDKLKQIDHESLCLAHFGCIYGSEAATVLDDAAETYKTWWQLYERHADRLGDTPYMLKAVRNEIKPDLPQIRPTSLGMSVMFGLLSRVSALMGRETEVVDRLAFGDYVHWLATGYRTYKKI